ncbi:MAG TPA: alpha/beta hydrolase [Anaerolineae bacterium]|nr:alpha/beta hydrolase [Anaerolineae bacterium]HMR64604.1 alpha/beta hydrolase [Anaerolineae bacterium]
MRSVQPVPPPPPSDSPTFARGSTVMLPDGLTHYELSGPPAGQTVVLVHGISTPFFIWDFIVPPLTEAGFRVLRYDLYGRGHSATLDTDYDSALFIRQLSDLLYGLKIKTPVDLVGISLGGMIVALFTDRYPALVRKLGLMAPAGISLKPSFMLRLAGTRLAGELMVHLGGKMLSAMAPKVFYKPERFREFLPKMEPQFKDKRYRRAVLSTMRLLSFIDITATYHRLGQESRPQLLIWGREDRTIPFETSATFKALMPRLEFHAIDQVGHVPPYESPEEVSRLLIEFLQR